MTTPQETKPNERGQWRNPPMPELMAERIHAFAKRWTKWNKRQSRTSGVFFVKAVWPDVELLDAAEALLQAARDAGDAGADLPSDKHYEFCERLQPERKIGINATRLFLHFAHRQWLIGRAKLAKRLLRSHHAMLQATLAPEPKK